MTIFIKKLKTFRATLGCCTLVTWINLPRPPPSLQLTPEVSCFIESMLVFPGDAFNRPASFACRPWGQSWLALRLGVEVNPSPRCTSSLCFLHSCRPLSLLPSSGVVFIISSHSSALDSDKSSLLSSLTTRMCMLTSSSVSISSSSSNQTNSFI